MKSTLFLRLVAAAVFALGTPASGDGPGSLPLLNGDRLLQSPDKLSELVMRGDGTAANGLPGGAQFAFVCVGPHSADNAGLVAYEFDELGSHSPMDGLWSADSASVALLVRHTHYSDLLVATRTVSTLASGNAGVSFSTVHLPPVPADDILENFPAAGKPGGLRFKLGELSITRVAWSEDGTQLSVRAIIGLLDAPGSVAGTSYHYTVDYTLTLPPAGGSDAKLQLSSVQLVRGDPAPNE